MFKVMLLSARRNVFGESLLCEGGVGIQNIGRQGRQNNTGLSVSDVGICRIDTVFRKMTFSNGLIAWLVIGRIQT